MLDLLSRLICLPTYLSTGLMYTGRVWSFGIDTLFGGLFMFISYVSTPVLSNDAYSETTLFLTVVGLTTLSSINLWIGTA